MISADKKEAAIKKRPPIPIPQWENADAAAIQALEKGIANEAQQKRALRWIIESACGTYDFCDQPQDPILPHVFNGRRFAGLQVVKLMKINLAKLKENEDG